MGISRAVSWKTQQYLPWRHMIPRDIVLSVVLAFGERVAERIFLPGLHRAPGRAKGREQAQVLRDESVHRCAGPRRVRV